MYQPNLHCTVWLASPICCCSLLLIFLDPQTAGDKINPEMNDAVKIKRTEQAATAAAQTPVPERYTPPGTGNGQNK